MARRSRRIRLSERAGWGCRPAETRTFQALEGEAVIGKQSQLAAEGAIAIQAKGNVQLGITYESARQIALDVYQANFPRLVAEAAGLARSRAEELTDKFLKQLNAENPPGLAQATRPDFQNALLNAQRDHACAGSQDLADLLVDLLVDRTKHQQRDLLQLVIDEALKTAPKLTEQQLAVLGAAFLLSRARSVAGDWQGIVQWMGTFMKPVLEQAIVTPSTLSHLQFTSCGTLNTLIAPDLAENFAMTYAAFFQTGFTDEELAAQTLDESAMKFIGPFKADQTRKEVLIVSAQVIDELRDQGRFDAASAGKLTALLNGHRKPAAEVRTKMLEDMPFLERAFELWEKGNLKQLTLTSVGMAIGHAFVKKTAKREFAPLSIWIK